MEQRVSAYSVMSLHDGEGNTDSKLSLGEGQAGTNQLVGLELECLQWLVDLMRLAAACHPGVKLTFVQHYAAQVDHWPSRELKL